MTLRSWFFTENPPPDYSRTYAYNYKGKNIHEDGFKASEPRADFFGVSLWVKEVPEEKNKKKSNSQGS
jgi:hypothetical protein